MRYRRAFTLVELLVVISVISLLMSLIMPALGKARHTALVLKNATQIRGIHQALVAHAQSNNDWYVGIDDNGQEIAGQMKVHQRYELMIKQGYFSSEFIISPLEHEKAKNAWDGTGSIDKSMYSFGLLQIEEDPGKTRNREWRATGNSRAVVIADPNIGINDTTLCMSYHNFTAGEWRGHMGWNDNHVSLEPSQYVSTQYDNAAAVENDNAGRGDLIFNGDLANDLSPDSDALIAPVQIADGNP